MLARFGLISKIVGEGTPRKGVPPLGSSNNIFFLFAHSSKGSDIKLYFLFLRIELIKINFDIFDLILIFFKLSVGFVLSVEMREYFIIDSEFKGFTLLDNIEGEALESEGVLEGDVGGKFIFEEDFSVNCYFDFSRDE